MGSCGPALHPRPLLRKTCRARGVQASGEAPKPSSPLPLVSRGARATTSAATAAMAAARRAGHWRRVLGISAALACWQAQEGKSELASCRMLMLGLVEGQNAPGWIFQVPRDLLCYNEQLAAFADSQRRGDPNIVPSRIDDNTSTKQRIECK